MTDETQLTETDRFTEVAPGPLTVEDAFVRMQNAPLENVEPEQSTEPAQPIETQASDDIQWTSAEVSAISALQARALQVQQAVQQQRAAEAEFNEKYAGVNLNELEKTDKARAVQIRSDANTLQKQAKAVVALVNEVTQARAQVIEAANTKLAYRERAKLLAQAPRLNDEAHAMEFQQHLLRKGYTLEEIANCRDYQIVLAAYEAWEKPERPTKPKGKIPTKKPKQKQVDPEYAAAMERAQDGGDLRELATTLVRGPQSQRKPATVSSLKARLRQTGSVDDAYQLLQAQKQQRAS